MQAGRLLGSPALHTLTPAERTACHKSMVEVLTALHKVDWRGSGLENFGQAGNFFPRQLKSLSNVSERQEAAVADAGKESEAYATKLNARGLARRMLAAGGW